MMKEPLQLVPFFHVHHVLYNSAGIHVGMIQTVIVTNRVTKAQETSYWVLVDDHPHHRTATLDEAERVANSLYQSKR